jgi:hypothetical protein
MKTKLQSDGTIMPRSSAAIGCAVATFDYFSEKILPIYLQKPLPIIQLWKLQKKIMNEKAKNA